MISKTIKEYKTLQDLLGDSGILSNYKNKPLNLDLVYTSRGTDYDCDDGNCSDDE